MCSDFSVAACEKPKCTFWPSQFLVLFPWMNGLLLGSKEPHTVLSPFSSVIRLFPVLWVTWPIAPGVHWLGGWDARGWSRCGPHLCSRDGHALMGGGSVPPVGREGGLRAAFQEGNSTQMRSDCSQLRELAVPLGHSPCRSRVRLTSPRTTGPADPITDREVSLSQWHSAVSPSPQAPSWWHAHLFLHHYEEVEGWFSQLPHLVPGSLRPSAACEDPRFTGEEPQPPPGFVHTAWPLTRLPNGFLANPISPTHIARLARNVHSDKPQPRKRAVSF